MAVCPETLGIAFRRFVILIAPATDEAIALGAGIGFDDGRSVMPEFVEELAQHVALFNPAYAQLNVSLSKQIPESCPTACRKNLR